MQNYKVQKTK